MLPPAARVDNDVTVGPPGSFLLVTGSNMSGKSTFLRTLGVNLCLAFAGGPVDAGALQTVPFRLFTCIQVSDSVNDGISYFYAEVRRLKALLAELNRYWAGHLILRDASLGSVLVSFAVNLDNLPEALDILQQLYGVEVMRLPGGIALLSRA